MKALCVSLVLLVVAIATAEEPRTWVGPKIESINTLEGGSLLDVVNKIRAEIKEDKDSAISVRIEVSDEELSKHSVRMALKEIPATVALSGVASIGVFEFAFENGVWVLRNPPIHERKYPDDVVTLTCELATPTELAALGLAENDDGKISTREGSKWPKEKWGKMQRIEDVIVVRAYRQEIESFKALLRLHRRGYTIPKINSEQRGGAEQPATAPESKPQGNEKPKPESEGRSQ